MKVLITGMTGYIGENFVSLSGNKYEIASLTRNITESNVTQFVYTGKLADVEKAFQEFKPDVVVHFASKFIVDHKSEEVEDLVDSNILFGTFILEAMKNYHCKKMINIGTSWQHFHSENYLPVNLYAATKEAFQAIVDFYTDSESMCVITLKLFDTYGPKDKRSKILNIIKKHVLNNQTLEATPGDQVLDFLHIEDVILGVQHAIELLDKNTGHQRYSLRSTERYSLKEIVEIYNSTKADKVKVVWGKRNYRTREVMSLWSGGVVLPGWQPKHSLRDGLDDL